MTNESYFNARIPWSGLVDKNRFKKTPCFHCFLMLKSSTLDAQVGGELTAESGKNDSTIGGDVRFAVKLFILLRRYLISKP